MELTKEAIEARRKYYREYKTNRNPEAREAYNRYNREWRARNRDKVREYNVDYWERKAAQVVTVKDSVTPVSVTSVTSCQECGNEFTPLRKTARFCSDSCRVKFNRKNSKS
jgi:hypothetical protein